MCDQTAGGKQQIKQRAEHIRQAAACGPHDYVAASMLWIRQSMSGQLETTLLRSAVIHAVPNLSSTLRILI